MADSPPVAGAGSRVGVAGASFGVGVDAGGSGVGVAGVKVGVTAAGSGAEVAGNAFDKAVDALAPHPTKNGITKTMIIPTDNSCWRLMRPPFSACLPPKNRLRRLMDGHPVHIKNLCCPASYHNGPEKRG
jgi:hypothetical protein